MTTNNPFPKLSQTFRLARVGVWAFAAQALTGLAHIAWSDRAAIAAVAAGAAETAYRQVFPTGKLGRQLAALVAAYRQITAAAHAIEAAPAPAAAAPTSVAAPPAA